MAFINSISDVSNRNWQFGGPFKIVQTPNGSLYAFLLSRGVDTVATIKLGYYKSVDYGRTWAYNSIDLANTHIWCSVWYDRWSGISGDLIHVTYADTSSDDVFYISLDTSTDTLGTERLVFTGASAATTAGATGCITVARGGNLYIYYDLDAGTETGFYRSTDAGATWSARSSPAEIGLDQVILMPGYAADDQDIMAFFWDASADEISRKVYDDSADSWAETSISTGMVEPTASLYHYGWAAAADISNSQNILLAWTQADTADADLKAWAVTESAITALTDVVTDGVDGQYLAAMSINGGTWRAYYCGASDGSSIAFGCWPIKYRESTDAGTTWGSEYEYCPGMDYRAIYSPQVVYAGSICMGIINTSTAASNVASCGVSSVSPGVNAQIGMN